MPEPTYLNGVEVELNGIFREFLNGANGKILGVAVADGAGVPLCSLFPNEADINVGRLLSLTDRLAESGTLIGQGLSIGNPEWISMKGSEYTVLVRRLNVTGGPIVCVFTKWGATQETQFSKLVARLEKILVPPPPQENVLVPA